MSFDYASLSDLAVELIGEFGGPVSQITYTVGIYDPATGANSVSTATTDRYGAAFDFGAGKTTERGTLIQVGDKQLLLDPILAVAQQDHFVVGGEEYTIVSIGEVNPAGTRVLYDIHLRA